MVLDSLATFCVSTEEPLLAKVESPLYVAVMGLPPGGSDDVRYVAVFPVSPTVSRDTPLLRKVTDPVGTPDNAGVTVATKVTSWPSLDGLGDDRSVVVVA